MTKTKKRDPKILIFGAIGVFNTVFDLALYLVVQSATGSIVIANIVATSAALIGSYLLNSRLTFKTKKWTFSSFALFVIVTIFGLWVLQTGAIYLLTPFVDKVPESIWHILGPLEHPAKIIVPKILASVVTLVWNFIWYNKVIFKHTNPVEDALQSLN